MVIAIALILALAIPASGQGLRPSDIAERSIPSIVQIAVLDGRGDVMGTGSGFFVDSPGVIATNFHVIEGGASARIIVENGESFDEVFVIGVDVEADLALLTVSYSGRTLRLGNSRSIQIGDPIYVLGHPLGLEVTFSAGLLSARRTLENREWLQISAPISPGSSGGPVLDASGHVVGVVSWTYRRGQNLNMAVGVDHLKELLAGRHEPVPLRMSAPTTGRRLNGFAGLQWGETAEDLRRTRGTPGEVDEAEGYLIYSYPTEVLGMRATETYYFEPDGGLAMGQWIVPVRIPDCTRIADDVKRVLSNQYPGASMDERLDAPPRGALCEHIHRRSASWRISWDFDNGAILLFIWPSGDHLHVRIIYNQILDGAR